MLKGISLQHGDVNRFESLHWRQNQKRVICFRLRKEKRGAVKPQNPQAAFHHFVQILKHSFLIH